MKLKKEVYIANYEDENLQTDNGKLILFKLVPYEPLTNKEFKKYFKMKQFQKIKLTLEVEESILDDVEKRYLSNFIKPFRNKVKEIVKYDDYNKKEQYLVIYYNNSYSVTYFPKFPKGTMYKGMENDKLYTLEELGL